MPGKGEGRGGIIKSGIDRDGEYGRKEHCKGKDKKGERSGKID